ncbi:trypsin-like serine protease [Streptomyces sp. NPDC019396]|uniref:trypsin-like serine peptidase n=1 Tax=Streptomyces sp. NPDC019396 TaxID=3154687 RepID=UPI0033E5840B
MCAQNETERIFSHSKTSQKRAVKIGASAAAVVAAVAGLGVFTGSASAAAPSEVQNAVGFLQTNFNQCTATLVARNVITTSAHCVLDGENQRVSEVAFTPGKDGQEDSAPFGIWEYEDIYFPEDEYNEARDDGDVANRQGLDFAFITLKPNGEGQYPGDFVNPISIDFSLTSETFSGNVEALGYTSASDEDSPDDNPYNVESCVMSNVEISKAQEDTGRLLGLQSECRDIGHGASGGPWFRQDEDSEWHLIGNESGWDGDREVGTLMNSRAAKYFNRAVYGDAIGHLSTDKDEIDKIGNCSATLVAKNVVVTAAHCVNYEADGNEGEGSNERVTADAADVSFSPGRDGDDIPYGTWDGEEIFFEGEDYEELSEENDESKRNLDFAFVRLQQNADGKYPGDFVNPVTINFSLTADNFSGYVEELGYTADPPSDLGTEKRDLESCVVPDAFIEMSEEGDTGTIRGEDDGPCEVIDDGASGGAWVTLDGDNKWNLVGDVSGTGGGDEVGSLLSGLAKTHYDNAVGSN